MKNIERILLKKFEASRVVIWCDKKGDLASEYEAVTLPSVEKVEVKNNEFSLQYRILRAESNRKFLLYVMGEAASTGENWLLNLEKTFQTFNGEKCNLIADELSLGEEGLEVVKEHCTFFRDKKRMLSLQKFIANDKSVESLRLGMLSVLTAADGSFENILEILFTEFLDGKCDKFDLIEKCELTQSFWKICQMEYGYLSCEPTLKDFLFRLLKFCYLSDVEDVSAQEFNNSARIFVRHWMESPKYREAYKKASEMVCEGLNLKGDIYGRNLKSLVRCDLFLDIDKRILGEILNLLLKKKITAQEVSRIIRERRYSLWFERVKSIYYAIDIAAQFLQLISENGNNFSVANIEEGFKAYQATYYKIDQLYRQFLFYANVDNQKATFLSDLASVIEKAYLYDYLHNITYSWQYALEHGGVWREWNIPKQNRFFAMDVEPVLANNKKVVVIISDALRYEAAEELTERLNGENRYTATIRAVCSMLPSFTALGMASLLPHDVLTLKAQAKGLVVSADGVSTQGVEGRDKVLKSKYPDAVAVSAKDIMAMNTDEGKAFYRDHRFVYVYHNTIDEVGDDMKSEHKTCEAVETALSEIIALVRHLTSFNASNIIVTADHGFLYQDSELNPAQYITDSEAIDTTKCVKFNRRFVLGNDLEPLDGLSKFSPEDLGFVGDCEIQLAKADGRLRLKGAGSQFVHGGATLQEIVVPVVKINKRRDNDTHSVEIEILPGTNIITAGQLVVKFYQSEVVGGKVLKRTVRVGLYAKDGTLISDEKEVVFDSREADVRDRERMVEVMLNKSADKYNNQHVVLKVLSCEAGTSVYTEYKTQSYMLRRFASLELDF